MSTLSRLAAYTAALALVFVGAWGLGRAVGPVGLVGPTSPADHGQVQQHRQQNDDQQHGIASARGAANLDSSIFATLS